MYSRVDIPAERDVVRGGVNRPVFDWERLRDVEREFDREDVVRRAALGDLWRRPAYDERLVRRTPVGWPAHELFDVRDARELRERRALLVGPEGNVERLADRLMERVDERDAERCRLALRETRGVEREKLRPRDTDREPLREPPRKLPRPELPLASASGASVAIAINQTTRKHPRMTNLRASL
jgi:hypothetical protein